MVAGGAASIRASGLPFVAVVGHEPSAEDADWIRLNMPGSRTEVWPDSGHFPHLAHPRRFATLLAETGTWAMGNEATVAASSGSI
jgi:pimeloyl-ACP methyl ester carboxylesterase